MTVNKQADLNIRNMALITPLNNLSYSEKHRELHANLFAFSAADSLFLCTARHVIKIQHCFHCYQVAICLILTSWLKKKEKNTEKHFAKLHFRVWTTAIYSVLDILYVCSIHLQLVKFHFLNNKFIEKRLLSILANHLNGYIITESYIYLQNLLNQNTSTILPLLSTAECWNYDLREWTRAPPHCFLHSLCNFPDQTTIKNRV